MYSMTLFDLPTDASQNRLPYDGKVRYMGKVLSSVEADNFFKTMLDGIAWQNDQLVIFGKQIITRRKVAWYGDSAFAYTYSNSTRVALPWTQELLVLKNLCEKESNAEFNSCLLNLYHNGEEGMAWHSDAEKELQRDGTIASLSLGAERRFLFKHKVSAEKVELLLEHGSLLLMEENTQTHWLHRLPPSSKIKEPRINLTFRSIVNQ